MINHLYALLRNEDGGERDPSLGVEYVPPDYRRVALPGPLLAVRAALFGSDPDGLYLSYRLRQLLPFVYSGDFADHAAALDPRVTFLPLARTTFDFDFGVSVVGGPSAPPLPVYGSFAADDRRGRCISSWAVRRESGQVADPARVPLPGSGLEAAVPLAAAAGTTWTVVARARPGTGPAEVLAALDSTGGGPIEALFGPDGLAAEPYATFGALWRRSGRFAERLAGALLALAYRTEEARRP